MTPTNIAELGLVGCGGAGFPTQVKLAARGIDHFIVNAAECEPLLHKDKEILHHFLPGFFAGLLEAMRLTEAKAAHIGIKKKYVALINQVEKAIPDSRISVLKLGDFYPAGDEYELVYEATGRLIPFGGIPLHIGCVVANVETLLNLGRRTPVVTKFLTIAGAVPRPITVEIPFGITCREALLLAGFQEAPGFTVIDGGPMMGKLISSLDNIVSRTCGGLIVLPTDHPLIRKMTRSDVHNKRIARSACDQCTDCSELCPRMLLGYPVRPHKAMRTAQLAQFADNAYSLDSVFCSECGLCTLFSCPEDLPPREITMMAKKHHLASGVKLTDWKSAPTIHPMRSSRRVGIPSLLKRLGLLDYDRPAPFTAVTLRPEKVVLPLKMHIGAPCTPLVRPGDRVIVGQPIGSPPPGKLGAALHATIAGRVAAVDGAAITIARE
jgi:Na+-translocating ferredoxin:NAD+ oxidoreductase RnfC subunit